MTSDNWNTVFQALSSEHRRRVLIDLLEDNPQADAVSVLGDVRSGDADLEGLRAKLIHLHLPKLEAFGYIRWDRDANEVVKGPKFDQILPVLKLLQTHRDDLPVGLV